MSKYRKAVPKKASAKEFSRNAGRTKAANVASGPMRGGWRL